MPRGDNKRLPESTVELVCKLRRTHTRKDTARMAGVSEWFVSKYAEEVSLWYSRLSETEKNRIIALATGPKPWKPDAIAVQVGRPLPTIYSFLQRRGIPCTRKGHKQDPAKVALVRRLWLEGLKVEEIVPQSGVSRRIVYKYVKDLPKRGRCKRRGYNGPLATKILHLVDVEGLGYPEVAPLVGRHRTTVGKIYRAAKAHREGVRRNRRGNKRASRIDYTESQYNLPTTGARVGPPPPPMEGYHADPVAH